uniref:Peptidase A1 domain-containing protein n=1 Tax=Oryza nivara TaxID=4536 RepID=A0A0E0JB10_ORYNI
MAPRGYLAEVALLTSASEDLAAVGPGEREGWLDDPAVLPPLAPRARALAVAVAARSVHAVAPVAGGGGRVTVRPALGPDDGRISAVEWIPLAGEDPGEAGERVAVAVGTDARWLLLYSLAGDLLHKQPDDELMSVLHNLPDINITCKARQLNTGDLLIDGHSTGFYAKGCAAIVDSGTSLLAGPIAVNSPGFCVAKRANWRAHLNDWLQLAVKPGIEELIINLSSVNADYKSFYLVDLEIHCGIFILPVATFIQKIGHLKCLTRIQLCMVNITENGLSSLLSISLGLERLELRHCSTIKSLKIPCLQRLSYLEVMTCDGLRVIESKAPNLSSFRFAGDLCVYKYHLVKQCKLSKSTAFYARTELPSSMPNLERLLIHSDTEMVNTQMLPSKFYHLKYLNIALRGGTYDYLSQVSFFDTSPFLETFNLNVIKV